MIIRKDPNSDLDPARSVPDYARLTDLRLSDMNKEEREYFTLEAALRRNTVAFDAHRLFIDHKSDADVTLRDGDEILIPSTQNTVYVFGQVARPGHVSYVPGMKVEYYISHAGQVSEAAVEGDIKIIKAGSRNWIDPDETSIEPGDAVWVPRMHERDFFFYFTSIRDLLQASVSIATVYLLFKQINSK
jgi:protein involved in polysaccharide export with SLBB domain